MRLKDCSPTIVGIAKRYCPDCFKDAGAETFNVLSSDTGMYLEDLVDLSHLRDADCTYEVWSVANDAIQDAKSNIEAKLQVAMSEQGTAIKKPWSGGYVGKSTYRLNNLTFSDSRGLYVRPKVYGSAIFLDKISLWSSITGTETVYVLRSDTDIPVATLTLDTVAGTWNENTLVTPIEFTYTRSDETDLSYRIVRATTGETVDNDDCGCGAPEWIHWATIGEVRYSDVADRTTAETFGSFNNKSGKAYGMRIDIRSSCDIDMCSSIQDPGFKQIVGRAILLSAAIEIYSNPNLTNAITPSAILDREEMAQSANNYISELDEEKIPYLAMLHNASNDCMECDKGQFRKTSLL